MMAAGEAYLALSKDQGEVGLAEEEDQEVTMESVQQLEDLLLQTKQAVQIDLVVVVKGEDLEV